MRPVIVVTELKQLPPKERWGKLVAPLQEALLNSGLGQVLDYERHRQEVEETGVFSADELAVELESAGFSYGYARELVDGVITAAGARAGSVEMPRRWRPYRCEDYFAGVWASAGCFDELSQTQVIVPLPDAYEACELQFLVIGHSGCDGIDFGYRSEHDGLWAYYPLGREFKQMADTAAELAEGWCSGRLAV